MNNIPYWIGATLIICALLVASPATAQACERLVDLPDRIPQSILDGDKRVQRRVAVVIANGSYDDIADLRNPRNDAVAMSHAFRTLAFETYVIQDGSALQIIDCIKQVREATFGADIGVLYYAGHGIQINEENYILASDASVNFPLSGHIKVDQLYSQVKDAWQTSLIILDACRTNPYGKDRPNGLSASTARSVVPIPFTGKLAVESSASAFGTFIAYSTDPDDVADDGEGDLSPFAEALSRNLLIPGISVQEVFARVTADVGEATKTQRPWTRSSLTVALKLAGDLTREDAQRMVSIWASKSSEKLRRGDRLQAIADAMKAIPRHARINSSDSMYEAAWIALRNAYRSTAFRFDVSDTESFVVSNELDRALLVRSPGPNIGKGLELWDTATSTKINNLFLYQGDDSFRLGLVSPVFSGNSRRFASIFGNGHVGVWDAEKGATVRLVYRSVRNTYEGSSPHISGIDLDHTGELLAVSGGGIDVATIWSISDGKIFRRYDIDSIGAMLQEYSRAPALLAYVSSQPNANLDSKLQFVDQSTLAITMTCSCIDSHWQYYILLVDISTDRITSHYQMQNAFSMAGSQAGLDYSLSHDRQHLISSGYDGRTSTGVIHLYGQGNDIPISVLPNQNDQMSVFSQLGNEFAIFDDQESMLFRLENGKPEPSRTESGDKFLHSPALFSSSGAFIEFDYTQSGRAIWTEAPPDRRLLVQATELLPGQMRDEVTRETIQFWQPTLPE